MNYPKRPNYGDLSDSTDMISPSQADYAARGGSSVSPYASPTPYGKQAAIVEETRVLEIPTNSSLQGPPGSPMTQVLQSFQPEAQIPAMKLPGSEDVASEKTVMNDEDSNPLHSLAKLLVLEGIQRNKDFPILQKEVSFGRERDNTISFPDLSVSRYHFKIHLREKSHHLEDLGSGNGTTLNGKKVKGTVPLKHGDRIQVGKTVLQYLQVGKPAPAAQAAPASKGGSALLIALSVVGVLAVGGVGLGVFLSRSGKGDSPEVVEQQAQAKEAHEEGVNYFRQRRWRDAYMSFTKAKNLDPKRADELSGRINEATSELQIETLLRKAKALQAQGLLQDALKVAEEANEKLGGGSVYLEEVIALRGKLLPKPAAPTVVAENPPPSRGKKRFKRRGREPEPPKVSTPTPSPAATPPAALAPGLTAFNNGDLQEAEKAFEQAKDPRKAKITEFTDSFRRGRTAHNDRNTDEALPALKRALEIDDELSKGRSVFTRQIRMMLANMYTAQGLFALSQQNYAPAFQRFRDAIKEYSSHPTSKQKLKELRDMAVQWYEEAKKIRPSSVEQSNKLLSQALSVIPREDKLFNDINILRNQ